jgi:type VI protein secretion system component VasF
MHRSRHRKHDQKKDKHRFYLLPGQGGRAHRRKQWRILTWSLIAALVVAGILAALMYLLNRPKLH